ncbi:hypothetical protein CQW23_30039 [Capsicum baccatum]|uniref:Uncharacterized protein n=1 Tax=Capsicum baccatum TaxID=33114 RepID=A0A2G2VBK4_CAPBA|nr:hypothetical protein CQW23_30039 [Capsicum baccatum]
MYKVMGAEYVDGQPIPSWKLIDGVCKESLAFETAQREGIPEILIQRAEELYKSAYGNQIPKKKDQMRLLCSDIGLNCTDKSSEQLNGTREIALDSSTKLMQRMRISSKKLEDVIRLIFQKKLIELYKVKNPPEVATVNCVLIAARGQPAPSTIGASSVYIVLRPDKKFYVGQVWIVFGLEFQQLTVIPSRRGEDRAKRSTTSRWSVKRHMLVFRESSRLHRVTVEIAMTGSSRRGDYQNSSYQFLSDSPR